jgi:hypothetical protein
VNEQQYVLRRKVGTAFYYCHSECMRALTSYTKVPLKAILTCDATCVECDEPLLQVPVKCLVHTDERPFCGDTSCPCYRDRERKRRYVEEPLLNGLISEDEAVRIFSGNQ